MDERTEKLLRELADKFGTTVDHLWSVLVHQAPINATVDCVAVLSLCGLSWLLLDHFQTVKSALAANHPGEEPSYRNFPDETKNAEYKADSEHSFSHLFYGGFTDWDKYNAAQEVYRARRGTYVDLKMRYLTCLIGVVVACVVTLITFFACIGPIITGLLNPEFWGLQQIIK